MKVAAPEVDRRARRVNAQFDLRMAVMKPRQTRQEPFLQEGGQRADSERTAEAVLTQLLHGLLQRSESAPYARQQQLAFGGQGDSASLTPEEWYAQVLLECAYLHAHRRRRHVERLRRLREAQMRGDAFKHAQTVQGQPFEPHETFSFSYPSIRHHVC